MNDSDGEEEDPMHQQHGGMQLLRRYMALFQRMNQGQRLVPDDDESENEPDAAVPDPKANQIHFELASNRPGCRTGSVYNMVQQRLRKHKFNACEQATISNTFRPNSLRCVLAEFTAQAFCGRFSSDGRTFLSAAQDQHIRLFQIQGKWRQIRDIQAQDVGWSVVDTDYSPDQRFCIYSSWSDYVHLCNLEGDREIHRPLDFQPGQRRICMFSIKFSPNSNEILGGSSDNHVYLYDIDQGTRVFRVTAHEDDVNSVCWADNSGQVFYSGSDDSLVKCWDRRVLGGATKPSGVLVGHCDGITCVSSKGDGRYLISNSKDQSMKLWDLRMMMDPSHARAVPPTRRHRWDYRWEHYGHSEHVHHPYDRSLMTYRGHRVLQTLVRCYFSPVHNTGQRYVYTGSQDGFVFVYDVLTGEVVSRLGHHRLVVRDVSWHPYEQLIVTSSWDGTLGAFGFNPEVAAQQLHNKRMRDALVPDAPEEDSDRDGTENDDDYEDMEDEEDV